MVTALPLRATLEHQLPSLFECVPAPFDAIQVQTPLLYPDGGLVDVYVMERGGRFLVTDHGEALGWLHQNGLGADLTTSQLELVEDISQTFGLEFNQGRVRYICETDARIAEAIIYVAEAAVRITDISYRFQAQARQSVADEVDSWLKSREMFVERHVAPEDGQGNEWPVDLRVQSADVASYVFIVAPDNAPDATRRCGYVFAACHNLYLPIQERNAKLIALVDDSEEVLTPSMYQLIEAHSSTADWSQRAEFEELLQSPLATP